MERTSKTHRKREALSLQELGEKLTELSEQQLGEMELPENVLKEVLLARSITKHGARKRQVQYLGVLMRKMEDVAPLREALQRIEEGKAAAGRNQRQVEVWRDELVNGNDAVLDEVLMRYPSVDRARLTELIKNAREQKTRTDPSPAASRTLYRFLYALTAQQASAPQTSIRE